MMSRRYKSTKGGCRPEQALLLSTRMVQLSVQSRTHDDKEDIRHAEGGHVRVGGELGTEKHNEDDKELAAHQEPLHVQPHLTRCQLVRFEGARRGGPEGLARRVLERQDRNLPRSDGPSMPIYSNCTPGQRGTKQDSLKKKSI